MNYAGGKVSFSKQAKVFFVSMGGQTESRKRVEAT